MSKSNVAVFNTRGKQDEVALAQLGAAVTLAWTDLNPDLKRALLTTAENMSGVTTDPDFRATLNRLVAVHDTYARR